MSTAERAGYVQPQDLMPKDILARSETSWDLDIPLGAGGSKTVLTDGRYSAYCALQAT